MDAIKCAVLSTAHEARFRDLVADELHARLRDPLEVHRLHVAAGDLREFLHSHAAQPFDALLMLVTHGSVGWARRCLQELAKLQPALLQPAVLLITRGVIASAIADLLKRGAADFLSAQFGAEELKARLSRLLAARAAPIRASPLAAPADAARSQCALAHLVGRNPHFLQQLRRDRKSVV